MEIAKLAERHRSPEAAWIKNDLWNNLTDKQKKGFPPICPDFVIELRSQSDALKPLQNKMTSDPASAQDARESARMQEYLASGLKLGWLIDPQQNQVEIYRSSRDPEIMPLPTQLSGENVLPGFILNLAKF